MVACTLFYIVRGYNRYQLQKEVDKFITKRYPPNNNIFNNIISNGSHKYDGVPYYIYTCSSKDTVTIAGLNTFKNVKVMILATPSASSMLKARKQELSSSFIAAKYAGIVYMLENDINFSNRLIDSMNPKKNSITFTNDAILRYTNPNIWPNYPNNLVLDGIILSIDSDDIPSIDKYSNSVIDYKLIDSISVGLYFTLNDDPGYVLESVYSSNSNQFYTSFNVYDQPMYWAYNISY